MTSCPICCESLTTHKRRPVECPDAECHFTACVECCQKYLLNSVNDAECMSCRAPWTREFIDATFTKAFRSSAYKQHREQILFEREVALLPTSQHMVGYWNRAMHLREVYRDQKVEYDRLKTAMDALKTQRQQTYQELLIYETSGYRRGPPPEFGVGGDSADAAARRSFVRRCPVEDCRGFLSTAWKCGTCDTWACPECHEPKGLVRDAPHACDPAALATAQLLRRDTRACPKCHALITKIDGCFAWDTPIPLYDGSTKMSQDIRVGDVLIGDDGSPRTVTGTCSGKDMMYEITQKHGCSYTVNSKHTLVLAGIEPNKIVEITVDAFLRLDASIQTRATGIVNKALGPGSGSNSIAVRPLGPGDYVGWSIDGNKRFVLGDFTVVRNCDQMWCVQCHTPFSWRTGEAITRGVIHNPHYYEWQRQQNGGVAPRVPGDVPGGPVVFDGLPDLYVVDAHLRRHCRDSEERMSMRAAHRIVRHIEHVELYDLRAIADNADGNADLRLKFLIKQIDETTWKRLLQQREKRREKAVAMRHVLEMFATEATAFVIAMLATDAAPRETLVQLEELRAFANDRIAILDKRFSATMKKIPPYL